MIENNCDLAKLITLLQVIDVFYTKNNKHEFSHLEVHKYRPIDSMIHVISNIGCFKNDEVFYYFIGNKGIITTSRQGIHQAYKLQGCISNNHRVIWQYFTLLIYLYWWDIDIR